MKASATQGAKPTHLHRRARSVGALLALSLGAKPAGGEINYDLSGFGTLGGAISDQDFIYQRYIDDEGTINPDTLLGIQLDTKLNDAWGITLQVKGAPSNHSDTTWEPTLTWAFLSWRPTNDWLLRAGRLRLPLLLYSANNDVGATFDFARLPTEVYSVTPTPDVTGLSFSKTWLTDAREWTLEGYLGMAHTDWRFYLRDGFEPLLQAGSLYQGLDMALGGLVLSLRLDKSYWRLGIHHAAAQLDYGEVYTGYPYVEIAPGIGYYQTFEELPGPGVQTTGTVGINLLTLGTEIELPFQTRFVGEYVRRQFENADIGPDVNAGYLALLRPVGRLTPYVYWAGIRTTDDALNLFEATNGTRVPAYIPSADFINAAQIAGADFLAAQDQQSFAVGASYSPTPTSKIKAEWMHVRTGAVSSFVDAPAGEESGGRQLNVFSLSYSFMF
ncbi:hypothetical protein [Thiocystis violacea]|uniref:hypothetical protein n=1 Tax=Thiocystis violacea TaxID=13725 RepID=UPI0019089893|nr:hypothetical protein [Thiocystis violacea]MBK1720855.1 hypothetical protein [Thiocystis violacea]